MIVTRIVDGIARLQNSQTAEKIVIKIDAIPEAEPEVILEEAIEVNQPIDKEIIPDGPLDKPWFPRQYCNVCTSKTIGIIQLKDNNKLCFICFELVKTKSGLKLDAIHELDLFAIKKHLKPAKEKPANEHVLQENKTGLRRRGRPPKIKV